MRSPTPSMPCAGCSRLAAEARVSSDLTAWLATRQPPPPAGLARALEQAVQGSGPIAGGGAVEPAAGLATAAVAALRRALALGEARPAAYQLLAADALLTYAIERAAEAGVREVEALLDRLTPAAFGAAAGEGS
jgi:hypothetical protein